MKCRCIRQRKELGPYLRLVIQRTSSFRSYANPIMNSHFGRKEEPRSFAHYKNDNK